MPASSTMKSILSICAALMAVTASGFLAGRASADDGDWVLTFSDEFDGTQIDTEKWDVSTRKDSFNNEKQYYLPQQVSVVDGVLRITSTHEPYDGKDYRSGKVESRFTQAYGRFEARAKIPTTRGIWPAFWLLPHPANWPHDGEIDIMEHGGSDPGRVSSAYHYANEDGHHAYVHQAYRTRDDSGNEAHFPDDFHVYAVEWTPSELTFSVDGATYYSVDYDQVPISDVPMGIILNTAVGGWFDGDPDQSTAFPQYFDVDYVRVYKRAGGYPPPTAPEIKPELTNGDFELVGNGWKLYTNASVLPHNLNETHRSIAHEGEGGHALKLYGGFGIPRITEAAQRYIRAEPGKTYTLRALARTNPEDSLAGTGNRCRMYLRFVDAEGQRINDSGDQKVAVDKDTVTDQWHEVTLQAVAPSNADTLEVGFVFDQPNNEAGAAWIDQVSMTAE